MMDRTGELEGRVGKAERETKEVTIEVEIGLDGGPYDISLVVKEEEVNLGGLPLYTHLLAQIFRHGELGGKIHGIGDRTHHLLEDVGICLGKAIAMALGDGIGIERMWHARVPLEGSFGEVSLDFGGRGDSYFEFGQSANKEIAGMVQHILKAMAHHGRFEIQCAVGRFNGAPQSAHHEMEALAKAVGRSLQHATRITREGMVPSTKEVL